MVDAPTTAAGLDAWLAYIESRHPRSIDLGLERVREVATRMALGRPAAQVVTVAGTNGKGSTVAFVEAIERAKFRIHLGGNLGFVSGHVRQGGVISQMA